MRRAVVIAVIVTTTLGLATTVGAGGKKKMKLTSPDFDKGDSIPAAFTCDGDDVAPTLRWKRVPDDAVELAITVEDPDAPGGTFVHWVAWGLDPEAEEISGEMTDEEVVEAHPDFAQGDPAYFGLCPPPGDDPHRYRFRLYALAEPVDLEAPTATIDDLLDAIDGTVEAKAKLVGRYGR